MSDKYIAVLFWWNLKTRKGLLADLAGNGHLFSGERRTREGDLVPVLPDSWEPPTVQHGWIETPPTLVWFSIEYCEYSDGRPAEAVLSVETAEDFSQEDYETLMRIRQDYDRQRSEERKARRQRYERRESAPRELGFRIRKYERV